MTINAQVNNIHQKVGVKSASSSRFVQLAVRRSSAQEFHQPKGSRRLTRSTSATVASASSPDLRNSDSGDVTAAACGTEPAATFTVKRRPCAAATAHRTTSACCRHAGSLRQAMATKDER